MTELAEGPSERLARLADRAEITEVLARYCRGVDRCDEATLADVYHPDATDDHGTFTGPAREFAAWAVRGAREAWHSSSHSVHNVIIDWTGPDEARVESYVLAFNVGRARTRTARSSSSPAATSTASNAGTAGGGSPIAGPYGTWTPCSTVGVGRAGSPKGPATPTIPSTGAAEAPPRARGPVARPPRAGGGRGEASARLAGRRCAGTSAPGEGP